MVLKSVIFPYTCTGTEVFHICNSYLKFPKYFFKLCTLQTFSELKNVLEPYRMSNSKIFYENILDMAVCDNPRAVTETILQKLMF